MTIPNDLENRWWVEASGANAVLVDSFRPALVAFLAFDRDRFPRITGTGFVLASAPDFALVMTAKHVFTEGVLRAQRPHPSHAASSLFIPKRDKTPALEPEKLKVMWMGSENAAALNATHACYNDSLDIASCVVMPQQEESISENISIPLDTDVPEVGEVVHMVAMVDMEAQESAPPVKNDGKGQVFSIERKISIRVGVVTAVYPQGFRQYRWPSFTTSIPAVPGMSGGFVYWPREGKTIAACGVVCADNSSDEAHLDIFQCGESVIGCVWPALSLRVPHTVPANSETPDRTLYEMIQRGNLPKPLGDFDLIRVIEADNGDCRIGKGI